MSPRLRFKTVRVSLPDGLRKSSWRILSAGDASRGLYRVAGREGPRQAPPDNRFSFDRFGVAQSEGP